MTSSPEPRGSRRAALRGAALALASAMVSACRGGEADEPGASAADAAPAPPDGGPPPPRDASPASPAADGAAPAVPRTPLAPRPRELVDVHAHFVPEAFRSAAAAAGYDLAGSTFGEWSLEEHLSLAEGLGVATSVLSLPAPGVHVVQGAQAVALARTVNDEAAAWVARAPERLRFFAVLPLPDVEAALSEWSRAAELPGCVGAVLFAEAGGVYVGAPELDPLLSALNASGAAVLIHGLASRGALAPSLEAAASLTRAAMTMFEGRVVTRFAGARFILAGAGGVLPGVLDRIQTFGLAGYTIPPAQTQAELAGLYFDCAGAVPGTQLPALLKHVPITRFLYGSDSGALPFNAIAALVDAFDGELAAAPGKSLRRHCIENGAAFALA